MSPSVRRSCAFVLRRLLDAARIYMITSAVASAHSDDVRACKRRQSGLSACLVHSAALRCPQYATAACLALCAVLARCSSTLQHHSHQLDVVRPQCVLDFTVSLYTHLLNIYHTRCVHIHTNTTLILQGEGLSKANEEPSPPRFPRISPLIT
jgi:hypothetical protein